MQIANPLPRQNTVRTTSTDGVPIAYEVIGTGRPLMLLHGFPESRACWLEAGYVERFAARGRQLVLVDCRGHGESGKPYQPTAYSARKCAADVAVVLDDAGIAWTDVMGHSMGGAIALAAALHIPDRGIGGQRRSSLRAGSVGISRSHRNEFRPVARIAAADGTRQAVAGNTPADSRQRHPRPAGLCSV
jgi:pimeloyl-ACP methyl ester carboxylesterase